LNTLTRTINCLGKLILACFRRTIQAMNVIVTLNKALLKLLKILHIPLKRTRLQELRSLLMDLQSGIKL
jgi:hypothetical protein